MSSPSRIIFLPLPFLSTSQIVQSLSLGLQEEYLVLPSTVSHCIIICLYVLFMPSGCRVFECRVHVHPKVPSDTHIVDVQVVSKLSRNKREVQSHLWLVTEYKEGSSRGRNLKRQAAARMCCQ